MACNPSATLTLFRTVTSTTIITTSTLAPQTQPDGSVVTVTQALIITSLITLVNPTETQYASCPSTTTAIGTTATATSPQQSPTTTITITTTPSPTVVTVPQTTTLGDGAISVYSITSTSTPPATTLTWIPAASSQPSKSSNSVAPIAAGAAGGFILLISAVALAWFIWKKCRSNGVAEEEEVVFPYPVTRDRHSRRLDLTRESRAYEYGHVGRTSQIAPGSPPPQSHDGRPESSAGLIGASSAGLTPMASASGTLATMYGAQTRVGDVGRQASQNSHLLPAGAAPPDHHSRSAGSVSGSSSVGPTSSNRGPLQVMNSPPSPTPQPSVSSSGAVPGSTSPPFAMYESEKQSAWPGKSHARGASSMSGAMLSNDSHLQGRDDGPSGSGPVVPEPTTGEPLDAPPAYED